MACKLTRLLILLILLLTTVQPAQAAAPLRFTLADLGKKDVVMRSIFDRSHVHFPLAEGRQIKQAMLKLHLSHSKKLLPNLSDLTVALNDEPVANLVLTPENADARFVDVPLPVEV